MFISTKLMMEMCNIYVYLAEINDSAKYSKFAFSLDRIFKGISVDSLKIKKTFVTRATKKEEEERTKIKLNNMGKLDQL